MIQVPLKSTCELLAEILQLDDLILLIVQLLPSLCDIQPLLLSAKKKLLIPHKPKYSSNMCPFIQSTLAYVAYSISLTLEGLIHPGQQSYYNVKTPS